MMSDSQIEYDIKKISDIKSRMQSIIQLQKQLRSRIKLSSSQLKRHIKGNRLWDVTSRHEDLQKKYQNEITRTSDEVFELLEKLDDKCTRIFDLYFKFKSEDLGQDWVEYVRYSEKMKKGRESE